MPAGELGLLKVPAMSRTRLECGALPVWRGGGSDIPRGSWSHLGGREVREGFTQRPVISLNIFLHPKKCDSSFPYLSVALPKYNCSDTGTSDLPPCICKVFVDTSHLPY